MTDKKFDLEKWIKFETNLLAPIDRIHAKSCIRLGYLKAQSQFEGEKQRVWDAAQEIDDDRDECGFKYDTLADYEASLKTNRGST